MDKADYQRILNNIITQAPLECGVQTLVYMLLDEIINQKYGNQVRVLVADLRDKNCVFGGSGGNVDLCIVNDKFKFISNAKREDQRVNQLGCVEVKVAGKYLPDNIGQIAGHIQDYKKVLYTNGIVWVYFECPNKATIESIQRGMRYKLCKYINSYPCDNEVISNRKTELEKSTGLKWFIPLSFTDEDNKEVLISATTGVDVKINKDQFKALKKELIKIEWVSQIKEEKQSNEV